MVSPTLTAQSIGSPKKIVLQPLDQAPAPGTNNYYPAITTIYSEPRPQQEGGGEKVFVETFLIDAISTPNKKGWKVSYDNPTDFDRRVQDSKNHPLVLFQTKGGKGELIYDHPVAPITTLEQAADPVRANIEFQKKYTIGFARHFKKVRDGIWHATYEIVNDRAKKFFLKAKAKGLKLFTSPYIVRPASEPDRTNIKEWALIHNAIVSSPAHNEQIASIKDICSTADNPMGCQSLFASLTALDTEDCGFCVEGALEAYALQIDQEIITSHDNISLHSLNMAESASNNNAQTTVTPQTTSSTVTTQTIPQNNIITEQKPLSQLSNEPETGEEKQKQQNEESQQDQQQQQKQDQEQQKEKESASLRERIAQQEKQIQDLQAKYAFDTRKANIEKIFAPIVGQVFADPNTSVVDEKAYVSEITRLTKSNLNYDEISELAQARFITAQYNLKHRQKSGEKASMSLDSGFSSHGNVARIVPYTKMSTTEAASSTTQTQQPSIGLSVLRRISGELI
jgi:hypothetical protein